MRRGSMKNVLLSSILVCAFMMLMYQSFVPCSKQPDFVMLPKQPVNYVYDAHNKAYTYDRSMPLIFIGGVPRSGTTLTRAMLDAHPEIRCGEETRVIPRLLGMRSQWLKSQKEARRLEEAGLTGDVLDDALSAFILEIIAKHGEPAPRLCNKDPFTLKSAVYIAKLFPGAKFLLMIRDGRAVVHSIITRKVTITGFDLKNFRQCMTRWNQAIRTMYQQCVDVGPTKCMPVYYEQLVLHPKLWMTRILEFLDVPWNDSVLHHEDNTRHINENKDYWVKKGEEVRQVDLDNKWSRVKSRQKKSLPYSDDTRVGERTR